MNTHYTQIEVGEGVFGNDADDLFSRAIEAESIGTGQRADGRVVLVLLVGESYVSWTDTPKNMSRVAIQLMRLGGAT